MQVNEDRERAEHSAMQILQCVFRGGGVREERERDGGDKERDRDHHLSPNIHFVMQWEKGRETSLCNLVRID